jgi:hypothetical protein
MAKSHYLEKDRLANVIAAIQILGVSDQATATLSRWVAELEASEELTADQLDLTPIKYAERKKWAAVFEQHPEFFKTYTLRGEQRVLLRWRYAQSFTTANAAANGGKNGKDGARNDAKSAAEAANNPGETDNHPPVVSDPLAPDQIQVLINTAIELHSREVAALRKPDRLPPLLLATVGAALGTVAGGSVVVLLGWMQLTHMVRLFN